VRRLGLALALLACALAAQKQGGGGGSGNATSLQGHAVANVAPSNGNCLVFTTSWGPGSCSGTASANWSSLVSGTNTTGAFLIGTGASLGANGSGTIAATSVPAAGISGSVGNGQLANSSLTISTAAPLTGGSAISLGGSLSLGLTAPSGAQGTPMALVAQVGGGAPTWAASTLGVNAQSATTYTLQANPASGASDLGALITANNASAQTYTMCNLGSSGCGIGFFASLLPIGAGTVSLSPAAGQTITGDTALPPFWLDQVVADSASDWISRAVPTRSAAEGGDLGGTFGAPTVAGLHFGATALPLGTAPSSGQCLTYNGTNITGAACSGGGGSSSGTNLVQISNGTGGFISSTNLRADATKGFLGIRNDLSAPVNPLDIEWAGLSRSSSPLNLETLQANYSSTSASPSDIHVLNVDSTLSGTDAAFVDSTDALSYGQLTDTRTPSAASTVTHQLGSVSREFAQGGANLTCTICAAYYGTASLQASGETVQDLIGFFADSPGFSGTGAAQNYWAFRASLGSTVSGPTLGNVTGFSTTDPTVVTHNGGTGCVAGFAVGSGNCQTAGGSFAFFSDITAPSAFEGGLSVGKESAPADTLDVNGALQVGNNGGGSAQIDIIATDQGVAKVHLIGPTGSLTRNDKWPSASSTLAGVVGDYNNAAVTGNLGSQTLFSLPDASGRLFALHVYGVCTSSVAGSTVTITVTYNDDNGAQTQSSSAQSCAAAGEVLTLNTSLWANANGIGAVRISTTTANSPVYAIHAGLTLAGTNTINSN